MLEDLIELTENEVPITLSSLVKTVYKEPDNSLDYIESGCVKYYGKTNLGYGYCELYFKLGIAEYKLILIKYNENKIGCTVKLNDQVIIAKISREDIVIARNIKYID